MTNEELKMLKQRVHEQICKNVQNYSERLSELIEVRRYVEAVAYDSDDIHNVDEVLAVHKFLRMLSSYPFNYQKVRRIFKAYSALKFSGLDGRRHYDLTPIQSFILAATFGFMRNDDDMRRIVTEAVYFIPRKFGKTTIGAFIQTVFFFFEDANSEGYCVANSSDQAKILYNLTYDLIHQLDPGEKRIRFTATQINWKTGQAREAKVCALSAGGKTKDGLFAQLVTADEYGSAGYVKDKSDMANLLHVVEGSMGPRREPLTVITTTAGRVNEGPFEIKLRGMQEILHEEAAIMLDGESHRLPNDWQFLMALHPDQWELDDESLQKESVWKKVNPHLGITVQKDYYENEWKKMLLDPEKRKEQVCKLFNVFQSNAVCEWINPDVIRKLQIDTRIDDLNSDDGWIVFVGQDFSKGNDLCGQSYLCWNSVTDEFFADLDSWITEETLESNSNRLLYEQWVNDGWLHVCNGAVIDENVVCNRLIELHDHLLIRMIGYDSYDSKRFINSIESWLFSQNYNAKEMIGPVSQTFGEYNSPVEEIEYMTKVEPAKIHFSPNPMWPWQFGNCVIAEDPRTENKKPLKRSPNAKVDNVQCLCSALSIYDKLSVTIR